MCIRDRRKVLLKDDLVESLHMDEYVKKIYDRSVSEINVLPYESEIETNRRRIGYLNIRFFMQTLLNRMAVSYTHLIPPS